MRPLPESCICPKNRPQPDAASCVVPGGEALEEHAMIKMLACAAVVIAAITAIPAPAGAAERNAAGVTQIAPTDVSAARRYYRHGYRHYGYRYHRHRYYGHRYYRPRSYGHRYS